MIDKQPRQDLRLCSFLFTRYSEKCFPKFIELCMETWHQKCTSQKKHNDTHRAVAMTTAMLLVSF